MKRFIAQVVANTIGLWLAVEFVSQVELNIIPESSFLGFSLTAEWQLLILLGVILALLNFFLKPLLKIITFPLKIVTLGLIGLIMSMGLIKIVDLLFVEFKVAWFYPLFWTTIIIWGLDLVAYLLFRKE